MAEFKYTFSAKVASGLKNKLSKEIVNAVESSPELRKEIARVFQQANRRIQNVEKTGLYSPAIAALGKQGVKGYSKFSISQFKGSSNWTALKEEYGKAVAFLNMPTSTASGTREYNEQIRKKYDLSTSEYQALSDAFTGKLDSLSESEYVEFYLMRYKDFSGDFEAAFKSSSSQLESEAQQLADALEEDIESQSEQIANETESMLNAEIAALFEGFGV